jgi:hypothetical protein
VTLVESKQHSTPTERGKATRGSVERLPMGGQRERDVTKAVQAMDIEHVQCRDFGHSWRPFTAHWVAAENAYESQLRCARCQTIRTRWLSKRGAQLSSEYDYPPGYQVTGLGRLTGTDRDTIRLSSVLSVLDHDTTAEGA